MKRTFRIWGKVSPVTHQIEHLKAAFMSSKIYILEDQSSGGGDLIVDFRAGDRTGDYHYIDIMVMSRAPQDDLHKFLHKYLGIVDYGFMEVLK